MERFAEVESNFTKMVTESLNHDLLEQAGRDISHSSKVLFLSADYNKNIVSFFGELLFFYNIILTVINRDNDDSVIMHSIKQNDVILTSCLSGNWILKKKDLIDTFGKPFYGISLEKNLTGSVIRPVRYENFNISGSFYGTQKYLQTVFILLNYYIHKDRYGW